MMQIGPVIHQVDQDQSDPLVELAFEIALKQGRLEEPPEELQGKKLQVEYISIIHQAMKAMGLAGVERTFAFLGGIGEAFPEVRHKVDAIAAIDVVADMTGCPARIIRSEEEVEERMAEEQANVEQSRALEQGQVQAGIAKDLGNTPLNEPSALQAAMAQAQAGNVLPGV
jgi:hypothetical protein